MTQRRTRAISDVTRLFGGFVLVAAIVLGSGLFSLRQLTDLYSHVDALGRQQLPNISLLAHMDEVVEEYRGTQLQHAVETHPQRLSEIEASLGKDASEAEQLFRRYERLRSLDRASTSGAEPGGLWGRYLSETSAFLDPSRRLDKPGALAILNGPALTTFGELTSLLTERLAEEEEAAARALEDASAALSVARMLTIGLMSTGAVIVLVMGIAISLLAIRSARRTAAGVERLAAGEREAALLNRFTEVAALSDDDATAAAAMLATVNELVGPDDSAIHISNQSQDRAVPEATLGEQPVGILSLHELGRCPALRRSALYVTHDVTAGLSFRCPVYPTSTGSVACVPLIALGEPVGVAHLHWNLPRELSLQSRNAITRVTEHAALSIANRRLLLALRSQAGTDARTGLANSRSFDEAMEARLAARRDGEQLAVLMLDLDHFKDFNDAHGHPAGDEALRVFGEVLRSCVRDGDVAARYGGEEFAVMLPGLSSSAALHIAERIRERTESSSIALAPGKTGRLTVSIGIAVAPEDSTQRVSLLRLADEALYRAKAGGRNRVVSSRDVPPPLVVDPADGAAVH